MDNLYSVSHWFFPVWNIRAEMVRRAVRQAHGPEQSRRTHHPERSLKANPNVQNSPSESPPFERGPRFQMTKTYCQEFKVLVVGSIGALGFRMCFVFDLWNSAMRTSQRLDSTGQVLRISDSSAGPMIHALCANNKKGCSNLTKRGLCSTLWRK